MADVLITGSGRSGSWQIRGVQLGEAIGATVHPLAGAAECRRAELVVVVKRCPLIDAVRQSGRRWVWDVVDAWPQGRGAVTMDERQAKRWLRQALATLRPDAVVWPTQRMQDDAQWDGPQIVLPHHAWPRYQPRAVAERVSVVGYEGAAAYLGKWRAVLEQECALRGWRFEVNGDMARADVGVALRDGGGYPAAHWKSNCKLANLQALGIPALCSPEAGYRETDGGSAIWVRTAGDLAQALEALADPVTRARMGLAGIAAAPRLDRAAAIYREWLDAL